MTVASCAGICRLISVSVISVGSTMGAGMLLSSMMMHWRVMGICTLGVPEEMEIEIVTTVGWEGAVNSAFNPGGAKEMLPALASQVITALGEITPSNVSGIRWLTCILHSLGRTVTAFVGVATFPHADTKNSEVVRNKMILRDMIVVPLYGVET